MIAYKIDKLRECSSAELSNIALQSAKKLFDLRMQRTQTDQVKTHSFKQLRRQIARIKLLLAQRQGENK